MISDPNRTVALSSLGWVERDAIWKLDVATGEVRTIACGSGARYASLHHTGSSETFAAAHHFNGHRFEVTVRPFSDPATVLARATVDEHGRGGITGDAKAWQTVPVLYVEYLAAEPWKDFVLVRLAPASGEVEIIRLDWYDDSYDKGYQGVIDVVPFGDNAVFAVQRSSTLIVQNLRDPGNRRTISLADRHGNPRPELRNSGKELWAIDYDTLVVVQTSDGRMLKSIRLQDARHGMNEFVGDFSFSPRGELCMVARPFSGDVLALDPKTLKTRSSVRLGQQPLELLALSEADLVSRDWKTGALLRGTLKRRWFAG